MAEYRIEYSIQKQNSDDEDFTEIGFGSSGSWNDVDSALHAATSDIQNRNWETTPNMPYASEVDKDD